MKKNLSTPFILLLPKYILQIFYPFLCILGEGMRRCGVAFFFLVKRNNKE